MLNNIADKIYYINLDARTDRRSDMESEFSRLGITAERVVPVDKDTLSIDDDFLGRYPAGAKSLRLATIDILQDAIDNNYDKIIILEDDVKFKKYFNDYEVFLDNLPDDWEMFHFGCWPLKGNPSKTFKGGFRLRRIDKAEGCHAYMINRDMISLYKTLLETYDAPIDYVTAEYVHTRGNSYSFHKNLSQQKSGWSDISESNENRDI